MLVLARCINCLAEPDAIWQALLEQLIGQATSTQPLPQLIRRKLPGVPPKNMRRLVNMIGGHGHFNPRPEPLRSPILPNVTSGKEMKDNHSVTTLSANLLGAFWGWLTVIQCRSPGCRVVGGGPHHCLKTDSIVLTFSPLSK